MPPLAAAKPVALRGRMNGGSGGVVRQGVQRPAVDHAVGIQALRPDVQLAHGVVRVHGDPLVEIMVHEGVHGHDGNGEQYETGSDDDIVHFQLHVFIVA